MAGCEMMAIGDSLFNGVRSLTIDATLAQWSAPAQLARALAIADFAVPDYPRSVVMNFEKWVREFPFINTILDDLAANIAFWNTNPRSALPQFDNIAIASSQWSDLCDRTWLTAQGEIDHINQLVRDGKTTYNDNLAALFFAFNTRFILNPTGDPATPAQSPLQIVEQRKPRRLIVSIGANNGLWPMAFSATACPGFNVRDGLYGPGDIAQLEAFIRRLSELPVDIEQIYLNALPHPSCTATMMPTDDDELNDKPGAGKFYPQYENRFGLTNYNKLSAAQVAANNAVIDQLKAYTQGLIEDPRIHIVPIDVMLDAYDFKTDARAKVVAAPNDGRPLSNLMIDAGTDVGTYENFWDGGLVGLDGMHPSIVGYNLMARTILDTIHEAEPAFAAPGALPTVAEAYAADTLLQKVPDQWDGLLYEWRDIREIFDHGGTPANTETTVAARSLMNVVRFKTN